jgi:hypothetical protein
MSESLPSGVLTTVADATPYAIPPGSHRILSSTASLEWCQTIDGVYAALTTPNVEPGLLLNNGFIKNVSGGPRLVMCKKVNRQLTYAGEVSRSNPLAFWRLNESAGTTAFDALGHSAYNLTYGTGITLGQPSPTGDGSLSTLFNGTADGDATSGAVNPWANGTALSFEALIYAPAWDVTHEMVINLGNVGMYMSVVNAQPIMSIMLGVQHTNTLLVNLPTNEWIHLACTWESGDYERIYVNGREGSSYSNAVVRSGNLSSAGVIYIGNLGGTLLPFSGRIANVALYLRKLSAAEIWSHAAARSNRA